MLRPSQTIVLCVVGLLMVGVIMVNSAVMTVKTVSAEEPVAAQSPTILTMLTSTPMVHAILAIAALVAASALPVRRLAGLVRVGGEAANAGIRDSASGIRKAGASSSANAESPMPHAAASPNIRTTFALLAAGTLALIAICAAVYLPGIGREVNGSHRWVNIPGGGEQGFQPSELAKWGLVLLMAWYLAVIGPRVQRFWTGLFPALVAIGAVAGFIVLEDLGTGALIAMVAGLVLLAGGARVVHFAMLAPIPIAAFVAAVVTSDYRMNRIMAFVHPYDDPEGIGYHAVQSLSAIAGGEGFGRGLGFGIQKLGYLPEDRTDFIFAVLCEEMGIPGAAVVVVLFAMLLWAGYAVMKREENHAMRLVCLGFIATVGLQAVINLAVVTVMAPTKGIALPLISAGGTGWVLTAFSLGLIVAIARTQDAVRTNTTAAGTSAPEAAPAPSLRAEPA